MTLSEAASPLFLQAGKRRGGLDAVSNAGPDAASPCRSRVQGTRFVARKAPMGSFDRHPDPVLRVHRADFDREGRTRRECRGKRHTARACPRPDCDRAGRPPHRLLRPALQFAIRRTCPRAQSEVRPMIGYLLAALIAAFPYAASAQTAAAGAHGSDWIAISMFALIVIATLVLTYHSAGRTKSKADFYSAGNAITPVQNGLAIAGDFLSAPAFLGISGLVYANGFDGLLYALGFLTGWPIVLFLMSERMRNLGSYTFADAAPFRLDRAPIRLVAATGSLVVVLFYLIAQMIGAGKVIELLFGVNYLFAVAGVGVLMILYVTVGGMQAT